MNETQLENEILFHASIAPFRQMHEEGIISDEDLSVVYTILAQEYTPIFVGNIVSN